jgi:hypothetical protein
MVMNFRIDERWTCKDVPRMTNNKLIDSYGISTNKMRGEWSHGKNSPMNNLHELYEIVYHL